MSFVSIDHASRFDGQVLSDESPWNQWKGECALGVQYVFHKAGQLLGKTSTWRPGQSVKGNHIRPGTAIASFNDGQYANHTAIFIRETARGLEVWDQFQGKPWGKRTLSFHTRFNPYSNNGSYFHVIAK